MVNCIVSDLIIRLKNAYSAGKDEVKVIKSKFIEQILKVLQQEGYIKEYNSKDLKYITVTLKYFKNVIPAIKSIRRISKPGCRIYFSRIKKSSIVRRINNFEQIILTTSEGIKTLSNSKVGGEVLMGVF